MPGSYKPTATFRFEDTPSSPSFDLQFNPADVPTSIAASKFATAPPAVSVSPAVDTAGLASAGIGAAGQAAGTLAQLAGQQAALQQASANNDATRGLSEKLAKLSLSQNRDQFEKNREIQAMMAALGGLSNARSTSNAARDVRRQDEQMLSDLLAGIYLR